MSEEKKYSHKALSTPCMIWTSGEGCQSFKFLLNEHLHFLIMIAILQIKDLQFFQVNVQEKCH